MSKTNQASLADSKIFAVAHKGATVASSLLLCEANHHAVTNIKQQHTHIHMTKPTQPHRQVAKIHRRYQRIWADVCKLAALQTQARICPSGTVKPSTIEDV